MTDHIHGKSIIVTGAGGGFGRLICEKAAARGAKVVGGDVDAGGLETTASAIRAAGGVFVGRRADVTDIEAMKALAGAAIEAHGHVDVIVNNAGDMPLAFFADHQAAHAAWTRCLDINIKGVLNGIVAVHDHMIARRRGQVVNISSIYGNFPVAGAGVYGATKAAVTFLSEALRVESQGKIKVTTIRPTGVPATGLGSGVVNPQAIVGILGQNAASYLPAMQAAAAGAAPPAQLDAEEIAYIALAPEHIADAVLHAIDQPWGVSVSDITVRASGDGYIL